MSQRTGEMWYRLAFRDYLRAHREEGEAYERLKRRLARTSDRDYLPTVNLQPEKISDDRVVEARINLFDRSVKDALRESYKK